MKEVKETETWGEIPTLVIMLVVQRKGVKEI